MYVLILPAFGVVGYICTGLRNNKTPFGYGGMVMAMFSIVCLGRVV